MKNIKKITALILSCVVLSGCGKIDTEYSLQMKNKGNISFEGYIDTNAVKTEKAAELEYDASACCPGAIDVANQLVAALSFNDTLTQVDEDKVGKFIDTVDGACGALFMGSGSTVDMVAIFECQNSDIALAQEANLKAFAKDQEDSFQKYIPLEAKRAAEALIFTQNNFTGLVIANDLDRAKEIMQQVF